MTLQPTRRSTPAPEDAPRRPAARAADAPLFVDPTPPPADPPAPAAPAPAAPALPVGSLREAHPLLCKPFAQRVIELKPGAMTQNKDRGLAMPYVDMRAYQTRLDRVCGPEGWSHTYTLSDRGVVCALTIFGVMKSATGDYPLDGKDENPVTSAEAQAFKRACAAFGLGRYLYSLPQLWGDLDDKKRFVDPGRLIFQMYAPLPKGDEE